MLPHPVPSPPPPTLRLDSPGTAGRTAGGKGTRPHDATTWTGRLQGRAGDGSDEEEEVRTNARRNDGGREGGLSDA